MVVDDRELQAGKLKYISCRIAVSRSESIASK